MAGAANVDADRVLEMAEGEGELTFITGDVMLSWGAPSFGCLRVAMSPASPRRRGDVQEAVLVPGGERR